jgi:predicted DNA-binding transcriptional regulator YafY
MPKTIQKTQDNSKYQRINTLYQLLSNAAQGYTIGELATQLDVSTKTIQRDLYEVLGE